MFSVDVSSSMKRKLAHGENKGKRKMKEGKLLSAFMLKMYDMVTSDMIT